MLKNQGTQEFWVELVDNYEKSHLSRDVFAKKHKVKPATFYYWLYKTRKERRGSTIKDTRGNFVEVSLGGQIDKAGLRLELPGGVAVVFEQPPSPNYVAAMVKSMA